MDKFSLLRLRRLDSRPVLVGHVRLDLVSDLATALASAELATLPEAGVPVNSNLAAIDKLEVEAVDCLLGFVARRKLNEAEAARHLALLVQAHDQVDNLAESLEELEQLGFVSVEREVADVECR